MCLIADQSYADRWLLYVQPSLARLCQFRDWTRPPPYLTPRLLLRPSTQLFGQPLSSGIIAELFDQHRLAHMAPVRMPVTLIATTAVPSQHGVCSLIRLTGWWCVSVNRWQKCSSESACTVVKCEQSYVYRSDLSLAPFFRSDYKRQATLATQVM